MEEALTALLRPLAPTHWSMAPQGSARPFIVLTRVSGGRDYTLDGLSSPRPARVQADVYGDTALSTKALARRLVAEVSGRRVGAITAIFVDSERDLPGPDATGQATRFRTAIDLMVHFTL